MPGDPMIRAVVLCDDVRTEDNGKALLIGVYSGHVVVSEIPFVLPLRIWVNFLSETVGELLINFRFSFAGKVRLKVKAKINVINAGETAFALPPFVMEGNEEGELLVEMETQNIWIALIQKKVMKGQVSIGSPIPASFSG